MKCVEIRTLILKMEEGLLLKRQEVYRVCTSNCRLRPISKTNLAVSSFVLLENMKNDAEPQIIISPLHGSIPNTYTVTIF